MTGESGNSDRLPAFPLEGGCICGAVRYALLAPPLSVYNCHCKDCQRSAGATHSMSMLVPRTAIALRAGETEIYDKASDSGRVVRQHSCPTCGTRIYNEPLSNPDLIVLRPGTLDNFSWALPVGNIWTASKASWVQIDPGKVNFEGQPSSREPLVAAWTRHVQALR